MFLEIQDVNKRFPYKDKEELTVLKEINVSVEKGEFISLLGPSGCGKSTLLSIVSGLVKPSDGKLLLNQQEIKKPGPDKGMVFQEAALFPWMSVLENVMFPLRKKMSKEQQKSVAMEHLKMVHLAPFADSYPHSLSGGMQQRVAIARALAMDPELLLMDEPFGALDEQTRSMLHEELEHIWLKTKKTILFVTHNISEAIKLSDRILVMGTRPGSIIKDYRVDLPRPRTNVREQMVEMEDEIMQVLGKEIEKVKKEELQYEH
ncbi:ABC transporter ATP-binding protein [Bacillus tianshenii]|nr:ABC transporter ATP-binding protein [Bacillus tianshenii]